MGGNPPLGYDVKEKKLIINEEEEKVIEHIFERFIALKSMAGLVRELNDQGYRTKDLKPSLEKCMEEIYLKKQR